MYESLMDKFNQVFEELISNEIFSIYFVIYIALYIAFFLAIIAAYWRVFQKLGRKGWESIIPIYSSAVMFKEVWNIKWFWLQLLASVSLLTSYLSIFLRILVDEIPDISAPNINSGIMILIFVFSYIVLIAINAKFSYQLSKKFGQDVFFAVGLFFMPTIFYLVLGFGSFKCVSNRTCSPDEIADVEYQVISH